VSPVRYGLYLCVPYGSHSKQRLFLHTALTALALYWFSHASPVRYGLYLCVPYGSHSKQRLLPHTALTGWAL
jgi:hypothetical protein